MAAVPDIVRRGEEVVWLAPIPPELRDFALRDLDAGKATALFCAENTHSLDLVSMNVGPLQRRGIYEEALLDALTATRTNNRRYSTLELRYLLGLAERTKLRAAGDPLPHSGPYTVYRGVAGRGAARRVRGVSWTGSLERARWFAQRFGLADPSVYRATVGEADVLAYSNGRQEDEYVVVLPAGARLTRVWRGDGATPRGTGA